MNFQKADDVKFLVNMFLGFLHKKWVWMEDMDEDSVGSN